MSLHSQMFYLLPLGVGISGDTAQTWLRFTKNSCTFNGDGSGLWGKKKKKSTSHPKSSATWRAWGVRPADWPIGRPDWTRSRASLPRAHPLRTVRWLCARTGRHTCPPTAGCTPQPNNTHGARPKHRYNRSSRHWRPPALGILWRKKPNQHRLTMINRVFV